MDKFNVIFYLLLIQLSFFSSFVQAQVCGDPSAVYITKNSQLFGQIGPGTSVSFSGAGVLVGQYAPRLSPSTSLNVAGSIRQINPSIRPNCTVSSRGLIWNHDICIGSSSIAYWAKLPFSFSSYGFTVHDDWGLAWDGMDRLPATYAVADATCTNLGGRLPTVSELWRSRSGAGLSSSNIAEYTVPTSDLLWAYTPASETTQYAMNLKGATSLAAVARTNPQRFRCVWNKNGPLARNCYLNSCNSANSAFWLADNTLRPAITFYGAAFECAAYGGFLPTLQQAQLLGLTGNMWVSNLFSTVSGIGPFSSVARPGTWNGVLPSTGTFTPVEGSAAYTFYCAAKKTGFTYSLPQTSCQGSCLTPSSGGFVVDEQLRGDATNSSFRVTYPTALAACVALGANLPTMKELAEMRVSNISTSTPIWLAGVSVNPNNNVWSFATAGVDFSVPVATAPTALNFYRCVWKKTITLPVACNTGSSSLKLDSTTGSVSCVSNILSNPVAAFTRDAWGYGWDNVDRDPATLVDATQICSNLGGVLPTPTQIWRARSDASNPFSTSIPTTTAVLMTRRSGIGSTFDTGALSFAVNPAANNTYRCVWPPVNEGNLFGGSKCYGPANAPCFVVRNTLFFDTFSRSAMSYAEAQGECALLGGSLPNYEQFVAAVGADFPNPGQIWLAEQQALGSNLQYPLVGVWTAGGFATSSNIVATSPGSFTRLPFRCVFNPEI